MALTLPSSRILYISVCVQVILEDYSENGAARALLEALKQVLYPKVFVFRFSTPRGMFPKWTLECVQLYNIIVHL